MVEAPWGSGLEGKRQENRQDWGLREREGLGYLGPSKDLGHLGADQDPAWGHI